MSELRVVDQFRAELLSAKPARRWGRHPFVLAFAGLALATSVATAATGTFPVGDPLAPWRGEPRSDPVPDSGRLQAVRADDPRGGPPWGLRVYRTIGTSGGRSTGANAPDLEHRAAKCEQIGRIVDGQIGVIETDGRFHALPLGPSGLCVSTGVGHRSAANGSYTGWQISNLTSSGAPAGGYRGQPCDCAGEPRWILSGLVGPNVVAVELDGHRYRVTNGRFLIVRTTAPPAGTHWTYVTREEKR